MKLIITRHGETIENQKKVMQGHLPGRLSDLGEEQAEKLAVRLKDEKIDYIYSSDLARAADTAKRIAKYHKTIPIKFVKELRERDLGEFQGMNESELEFDTKLLLEARFKSKNGESITNLYNRGKKLLYKILKKHKDDAVLFVGHNQINKAFIAVVLDKKAKDIKDFPDQSNTGVTILEIGEDNKHKIHLENCTKHLD